MPPVAFFPHLSSLRKSPHYADGVFHNPLPTPILTDGSGTVSSLLQSFFLKKDNPVPPGPVPTVKTSLKSLDRNTDTVIWLGHSSFFIQLGGRRILIDPVLNDHAAPVSFSTGAFPGSNPYTAEDLPNIDVLLISHDHWDHLDYATLTALRPKIRHIVYGLGVGAHLQRWGFTEGVIYEGDWGDRLTLGDLTVHITPGMILTNALPQQAETRPGGWTLPELVSRLRSIRQSAPTWTKELRRNGGNMSSHNDILLYFHL